jgi:hypothetical protein
MKPSMFLFLCAAWACLASPAAAGLLDQIKQKADAAARSMRDAARDVETVTTADERAAAEAESAARSAEASLQAELDVESRAQDELAATAAGRSVAGAERDVRTAEHELERAATTDERLEGEARGRVGATAADIERRTDLEAQADSAARGSAVGQAVRGAQNDVATVQREAAAVERAASDPAAEARRRATRETDGTARSLEDAGRAARELGSALD